MEPMIATSTSASRVRPDILTDRFLAILRQHGVVRAALFGSFAREEERLDSDIDLLVTFEADRVLGQEFLLAEELRLLTRRPVDVLTDIHPAFLPYIAPTLVPIPL
jgi:predicted nucleotidyltransferase